MKRAPALAGAPCLALRHRSERDAPAVDLACVAPGIVGHAQPPRAVEALDRQVAGVGLDDVVGAAAGAVVQAVHAAVRCEQVHLQVADVGVLDVHADRGAGRSVAAAAGHRDRAVHRGVVVDRVVAAVAVRLRVATAATAGVVVTHDAHAGEGRVALDPHVPGAGGRRGEAAGLVVAVLVRAAIPGAVGRRAAELHVQVGVAAAAGHDAHQVRGSGGPDPGDVKRLALRTGRAGHRTAPGRIAHARACGHGPPARAAPG